MIMKTKTIIDIVRKNGAWEVTCLPTSGLRVYEEVRDICKGNACGGYGKTWACPPAMGTVEESFAKCAVHDTMVLFTGKYDLEDSFDYEGMVSGQKAFHQMVESVSHDVREVGEDVLILANGGCRKCEKCTYPDSPCRFPETLFPALEGVGFNVSEFARAGGIHYINGADTVTYFAAVFFSCDDDA